MKIEGMGKRQNSKDLGPGGMRCPCCGPATGTMQKNRRQERRMNRRDWKNEVKETLNTEDLEN